MKDLPELPLRFHHAFDVAKAKAELEYATSAERFQHPQFTGTGLELPNLIQTVFFAYCSRALDVLREGEWTTAKVSGAREAAWQPIFDFYVARERMVSSDEALSRYRVALWRTTADEDRWKRHLREFAALAEAASAATSTAKPEGLAANPRQRATRAGRKPDHEGAARVAAIVARVVPTGDWTKALDDICSALDEEQIPIPTTWPKRAMGLKSWEDGATLEPTIARKAIEGRLDLAKKKAIPEATS